MSSTLGSVPRITCIEHPAAVVNTDSAIETVGGKQAIRKTINSNGQTRLELRLRPADVFQHPISSRSVTTSHSVVLKVRVKRAHLEENGRDLRKTLAAHPEEYSVAPSAVINHYVRFRELADFQYNTINSPFVSQVRDTLYKGDYEVLKTLDLSEDSTATSNDRDLPPPPRFSAIVTPFSYEYRQNPAVTTVTDASGETKLVNRHVPQRILVKRMRWADKESIPGPEYPETHLPPLKAFTHPQIEELLNTLKAAFEERPIWTRRALEAEKITESLANVWLHFGKHLIAYVAYTWKTGPWRTTYTKYGIDPRTDQKYAKYQTEYFRITTKDEEEMISYKKQGWKTSTGSRDDDDQKEDNGDGSSAVPKHVFDGVHLPSGRSFQLCDISDPVLSELLANSSMRETPTEHDGWYKATTMSKLRRLVRVKLKALYVGQVVKQMEVAKILEEESQSEDEAAPRAGKDTEIVQESADKERQVLDAVSKVSAGGGDKLKELMGILQQQEDQDQDDEGEYEIFDDDEDDEEEDDDDEDQ
ncbi:RNA polymerase III transcription factor IIIC subunit-domain-containing protein [Myxozyma melibiosi]|uniref:RNA polymerase III transcription factor IIIC subunit-domain-containing protein n=1 Tax=Myxozyma melibiosi TaxID=54550 RepID=A0ABR1F645_9ASCO